MNEEQVTLENAQEVFQEIDMEIDPAMFELLFDDDEEPLFN